jgi:NAD-dependent DNA ligase
MPSEKLTRILKARSPFLAEQIESMTDSEGWAWVYLQASPRKLPSVCFTGFSQADKDALSALAIDAHLRVVSGVSSSLSFLCAGENAGPAKLAKAKDLGVLVMDRAQFMSFLETGEIPI